MIFHMQMKQINGRNNLAWFKLAGLWVENIFLLNEMTVCDVEINKNHPQRINKDYLFRTGSSKRVSHYHSHLAETQRQAEELQSFIVVEKRKGFRCSCLETLGLGKPEE